MKLRLLTTATWHRQKYVSDDINSLKRKLLEVRPYLIITMEPVLYAAAGTRQLELIMHILSFSFSYSSGAVRRGTTVLKCYSLSRSSTLLLKNIVNLRHISPKWGSPGLACLLARLCGSLKGWGMMLLGRWAGSNHYWASRSARNLGSCLYPGWKSQEMPRE